MPLSRTACTHPHTLSFQRLISTRRYLLPSPSLTLTLNTPFLLLTSALCHTSFFFFSLPLPYVTFHKAFVPPNSTIVTSPVSVLAACHPHFHSSLATPCRCGPHVAPDRRWQHVKARHHEQDTNKPRAVEFGAC